MYLRSIILNDTQETQKAVSSPVIFFFYHNFCTLGQAVTNGIFFTLLFILVDTLVHILSFSSLKNLYVYYFIEVYT